MSATDTETLPEKELKVKPSTGTPLGNSLDGSDPNIVDWNGPDDAENPQNWSILMRWSHIILVATLGLVTYGYAPMFSCPLLSTH